MLPEELKPDDESVLFDYDGVFQAFRDDKTSTPAAYDKTIGPPGCATPTTTFSKATCQLPNEVLKSLGLPTMFPMVGGHEAYTDLLNGEIVRGVIDYGVT